MVLCYIRPFLGIGFASLVLCINTYLKWRVADINRIISCVGTAERREEVFLRVRASNFGDPEDRRRRTPVHVLRSRCPGAVLPWSLGTGTAAKLSAQRC